MIVRSSTANMSITACQYILLSSLSVCPRRANAQVHHQRYLLQPSALEIFLTDRSNALLNLPSSEVAAISCSVTIPTSLCMNIACQFASSAEMAHLLPGKFLVL